jgi:hypothetical protein
MSASLCHAITRFAALTILVFATTAVAFGADDASDPHPGVNLLEGAARELYKIDLRLERILSNETADPNGTSGAIHALSLNLRSIDRRVQLALSSLPEPPEGLSARVESAIADLNEGAVRVVDRARVGCGAPLDDPGVHLALEEVQSVAGGIAAQARHFVAAFWDRVIPVRFVQVHNCYPCAQFCDPHVEWDALAASVNRMNEVFAPVDLHFMIVSVERYYMYHCANEAFPVESTLGWDDAMSEIGQVFPIVDLLDPPPERTAFLWVEYMSTVFSDPNELLIWVFGRDSIVSRQHGQKSGSSFPNGGRSVIISAQNIFDPRRPQENPPQPALSPYHLTHEVGHFFGVRHTWQEPTGTNPYTGDPVGWPDLWDLVYCLGDLGLPLYFNSWEEADAADCGFHNIENHDPINCLVDNRFGSDDSDMECLVQDNFFASGHSLMKGLSFDLGSPENPPDSFAWGLNIMSYYGRYNAHLWTPGRFSVSQLSLIWGHARTSVPIPDSDGKYWPFENLMSQRDVLGTNLGD